MGSGINFGSKAIAMSGDQENGGPRKGEGRNRAKKRGSGGRIRKASSKINDQNG